MTSVLLKRGTNDKIANYIGSSGELVMDLTNNRIYVHDGTTKGGTQIPKSSDIPTKISQLINDANFSQLSSATATIDANIGTPSVTVSVTGSGNNKGLSFSFKNLKGATGAKGDKGDTGALGTIIGGAKSYSISYNNSFVISRNAYGQLTDVKATGTCTNCSYSCSNCDNCNCCDN